MKKTLTVLGLAAIVAGIARFFAKRTNGRKNHRLVGSDEELQLQYGEAPSGFAIRPEA